MLDRAAALPGVQSVGGVSTLPLSGSPGRASFTIEGQATDAADVSTSQNALVTPGYFGALGIDVVRGRLFSDHDDVRAPAAVLVSERFARQFFPNADASASASRWGRAYGPLRDRSKRPARTGGRSLAWSVT